MQPVTSIWRPNPSLLYRYLPNRDPFLKMSRLLTLGCVWQSDCQSLVKKILKTIIKKKTLPTWNICANWLHTDLNCAWTLLLSSVTSQMAQSYIDNFLPILYFYRHRNQSTVCLMSLNTGACKKHCNNLTYCVYVVFAYVIRVKVECIYCEVHISEEMYAILLGLEWNYKMCLHLYTDRSRIEHVMTVFSRDCFQVKLAMLKEVECMRHIVKVWSE